MEENKNIDATNAPAGEPAIENKESTEQVKQVWHARRNGRNNSGMRTSSASAKAAQQPSCGEVEDLSCFKEKLSGSNASGYEHKNARSEEPSDTKEVQTSAENTPAENAATPAEAEGPFFEEKAFTPRAIEVSLSDRRGKKDSFKNRSEDGVVSFRDEDCPKIGLFEKIKEAIKGLFGKSEKKGKFDRKGGHRHFNNNRKFHDNKRGGKRRFDNRRGGHGHRRFNDRRPNSGNFNRNKPEGDKQA